MFALCLGVRWFSYLWAGVTRTFPSNRGRLSCSNPAPAVSDCDYPSMCTDRYKRLQMTGTCDERERCLSGSSFDRWRIQLLCVAYWIGSYRCQITLVCRWSCRFICVTAQNSQQQTIKMSPHTLPWAKKANVSFTWNATINTSIWANTLRALSDHASMGDGFKRFGVTTFQPVRLSRLNIDRRELSGVRR